MKSSYSIIKGIIAIALLAVFSLESQAQLGDLSPYSRFGLGTLQNQGLALNMGMGGLSSPINARTSINSLNPATYASIIKPTFQAEVKSQWMTLSTESTSQSLRLTTINNFNFAFPFAKSRSAVSVGIQPYSRSGYNIIQSEEDPDVGLVNYKYQGEGGLTKAYVGFAKAFDIKQTKLIKDTTGKVIDTLVTLKHKVSLGANFAYYFGNLQKTRSLEFDDPDIFNSRFTSTSNLQDIGTDIGIHYFTKLMEKTRRSELVKRWNMYVGLSYTPSINMNLKQTDLAESYRLFSGVPNVLDTTYFVQNEDGSARVPESISAGIAFEYQNKNDRSLRFGFQYKLQDWSGFTISLDDAEVVDNSLDEMSEYGFGLEYTPKYLIKPGQNLLQKMTYRVGVRTQDTYLRLNDQNITEQAVTAGFSLPLDVSRSASKIHFGMEFGQRGSTDNGLISESFLNIQLGFSFTPFYRNNWFVQSKYD